MNRLQGVSDKVNYFVTINGAEDIDPSKVIRRIDYEHPLFDLAATDAQKRVPELHSANTHFCGAWTRYGFHEDGLLSGLTAAQQVINKVCA